MGPDVQIGTGTADVIVRVPIVCDPSDHLEKKGFAQCFEAVRSDA
jgi:hypothetical protein